MSRAAIALFCLLPSVAFSEDFVIDAPVTEAELFPQGALVTREVSYDLPAGVHRLILRNIAVGQLQDLRTAVSGNVLVVSTQVVSSGVPRSDVFEAPQVAAARAALEEARAAWRAVDSRRAMAQADVDAANAQIEFARGLGEAVDGATTAEALRAMAGVVRDSVAEAVAARTEAEHRIAALRPEIEDAGRAVAQAEAALSALLPASLDGGEVVLSVRADAPTQGSVRLSNLTFSAGWRPSYEVQVTTGDTPALTLERRIGVWQQTGETWRDVSLSVATIMPGGQIGIDDPWPWLRRIYDDAPVAEPRSVEKLRMDSLAGLAAAPVAEEADSAAISVEAMGMDVRYGLPGRLDLPSRAGDALWLTLDTRALAVSDMHAVAVPLHNRTAFLRATVRNDADEVLLPGEATVYRDGLLAGRLLWPLMVAGAEEEVGLGEIRGLTTERVVLDRNEGGRGVIRKSNEETEAAELRVENRTGRAWDVRLLDRVPYSEQEDLKITWEADPAPTETDVDDHRGVLSWRREVAAGDSWNVDLSWRASWPEGFVLR